ncbi:MAG: alcohol dehydrogenase catalytic domain-containing protein [Clostridiales Family XIII bacterium]|jgi:L-iditol 2-dehydrogenase|nr:alcohol dehydrogenase catalytic domain-containing protein [Clostridiales Family XIII bacterium]
MNGKMKAVLKKNLLPGLNVEEIPIPEIGEGEVLIKVRAAGICGSDVHMFEGADSYKVFEKFMPLVMGHEFCGDVCDVGSAVKAVRPGDRVVSRVAASCGDCRYCRSDRMHFCSVAFTRILGLQKNGGFAEYVAVSEESCILLPDAIGYELGALIEPLGVTGNAVNDSGLTLGETVVIQGPGPIGLLTLLHAKARGAGKCIVVGTKNDSFRLRKAKEFDADHIVVADEEDPVNAVRELTGGYGADVVFEASGVPQLLQTALDMCDKTGRVVVEGIYGSPGTIDFTPMVRSAKKLLGTYGGPIAWDRMIAWLSADSRYAKLPLSVITHRSKLEDAEAAFKRSVKKENIKELFIL